MSTFVRRSLLYTPATDEARMRKVPELDADGVIFDLEDSVPDDQLDDARENIHDVVGSVDFGGMEVCAKINAVESSFWLEDLLAVLDAGVDTVAIPKVYGPDEVETIVSIAEDHDAPTPEFIVYAETPAGVLHIGDVAATAGDLDPCTGMMCSWGDDIMRLMGTIPPRFGDMSVGMGLGEWMLNVVVMAARAAGLDPLLYPNVDVFDHDVLREHAERGRDRGYIGQLALHPDQLAVINDVFTPSQDDVRRAARLTREFEALETDAAIVDDVFLDDAMVDHFHQFMARYEQITGNDPRSLVE